MWNVLKLIILDGVVIKIGVLLVEESKVIFYEVIVVVLIIVD